MVKKVITLAVIVLVLFGFYKITSKNPNITNNNVSTENADLIIYWGITCPHCEDVKKFVTDNNLESKVKISWKEVYKDQANQKELEATVKKCPEIDSSNGVGVPLAFSVSDGKCHYGSTPIIDWLKQKTSQ